MGGTERWPRSVAGHVALDFVNTDVVSQHDRSTDILRSGEEFLAWCEHAGIAVEASTSLGLSQVQERALTAEAGALRTTIRSIVEAIAQQRTADNNTLEQLQSAYSDAIKRAVPVIDGSSLGWTWDPASPHAALSELAHATVGLLRDGPTDRIKVCPSCGFVFLDTTKNGSRRWCSMDDCGKQEKMRRYITKRAETRTRSRPAS
jgi:predicted RNA-binding Zn ribbon-like protein